jgi:hypothetical protein
MSLSFNQYGSPNKPIELDDITKKRFTGICFEGSLDDFLKELAFLKLKFSREELDSFSINVSGWLKKK